MNEKGGKRLAARRVRGLSLLFFTASLAFVGPLSARHARSILRAEKEGASSGGPVVDDSDFSDGKESKKKARR